MLIIILGLLAHGTVPAEVVLTEVMFDPLGSDYHDEYVEILNADRSESVDLSGWMIGDGREVDAVTPASDGAVLAPGQYGLILDPGYFESSGAYDPLPVDALLLTIRDSAFGSGGWSNSSPEPVILIDADGDTVASYTYSIGNKPGHSDEKIAIDGGDGPQNWADSSVEGGTPGSPNSVGFSDNDVSGELRVTPNPFGDHTFISYNIPQVSAVKLKI